MQLLIVLPLYTGIPMSESDNVHISNPDVEHSWPRTRLPLNSRHLTVEQIKWVGRAVGVPTDASVDVVHVMIEGKLRDGT